MQTPAPTPPGPPTGWNDRDFDNSQAEAGSIGSFGSVGSIGSDASVMSRGSRASEQGSKNSTLDHTGADLHCCVFAIGNDTLGLDVSAVGEVFQVERLVDVPLAPPGVLGLTNLRGVAMAVIDLASILDLPGRTNKETDGLGPALVLRVGGMRLAASIDSVDSVFPINSSAITESDAVDEHPAIGGFLTRSDDNVVSILDVEELTQRIQRLRLRSGNELNAADTLD